MVKVKNPATRQALAIASLIGRGTLDPVRVVL
jgi:hypothetical protein